MPDPRNRGRDERAAARRDRLAAGEPLPTDTLPREWRDAEWAPLMTGAGAQDVARYLIDAGAKRFIDAVLDGLKRGNRTAINTYQRMVTAFGVSAVVARALLERLGVSDESDLERIVTTARRVEGLSEDDRLRLAGQVIRRYLTAHPNRTAEVMASLGLVDASTRTETARAGQNANGTGRKSDG